jgi:hypothetical protein
LCIGCCSCNGTKEERDGCRASHEITPSEHARDPALQRELWKFSEELIAKSLNPF